VLSFINSEPFVYIKINNSVTTHLNKLSTKLLFGWLHHCKQETTLHCDWRLAFTASWACSLAQPRSFAQLLLYNTAQQCDSVCHNSEASNPARLLSSLMRDGDRGALLSIQQVRVDAQCKPASLRVKV